MSEIEATVHQVVVFRLGSDRYAVEMSRVREIIRFEAPRSVASPDPAVIGVISLRGQLIPVHDLTASLGLRSVARDQAEVVIVETPEGAAGIVVDDVDEVLTLPADAVRPAPPMSGRGIGGLVEHDGSLLVVLALDALLGFVEPAALAA